MKRFRTGIVAILVAVAIAQACLPGSDASPPVSEDADPLTARAYLPTTTSGFTPRLVQPGDFEYLGAFRLPDGAERPHTFEYGGNAMTFSPAGDPSGPDDGFPGSLFVTGHDRVPFDVPDGNQVAEISIPVPLTSTSVSALNQAGFLQQFQIVDTGVFTMMEEITRLGLAYLDHPATGPRIHLAWGQHFEPDPPSGTHGWFDPDLSAPDLQGSWFIGDQSFYSVAGYLFGIPLGWADQHAESRYLATGSFRDGGWSGMGPALFAYRPWADPAGTPPPHGTHVSETVLLLYASSQDTSDIERCLDNYQHPDEWEGGAWLTTGSGKSAVLFVGTKGTGAKYWYGWVNPAGPAVPCIEEELLGQFTLCRLADGTPCPPEDLVECEGHNDYRGWWSGSYRAQIILYDPADLARVAAGEIESWEAQPYATLDIDDLLYHNPQQVEEPMLGTGVQRRFRISTAAFDPATGTLYVLEPFADGAKPVVHVWRVH
jgi:hypothetical protein